MSTTTLAAHDIDDQLAETILGLADKPLELVMWAFPWDTDAEIRIVPWTEAAGADAVQVDRMQPYHDRFGVDYGPDYWACVFLDDIGDQIRERSFNGRDPVEPIREAIASGHGIGKSTMAAFLICFLMVRGPAKGTVTANTGNQLRTKTWAELAKWGPKLICAHWFDFVAGDMTMRHRGDPTNWRVDFVTWKEHQSEAFAGQHKADGSPFYLFDEASAIPDKIAEVAEGGLTDGEPFFFKFGNPTQSSGHFHRAFHAERHRWGNRQIDSREVAITNKALIDEWVETYGEDSDFVRVRVKGVFPRASATQFISTELVERARRSSDPPVHPSDPVVMGVDVAREGDDESVIAIRVGQDARTMPWKILRLDDTMLLVGHVAEYFNDLDRQGLRPTAINVDAHAIGAGVADRLRELGYPVFHCYNWPTPHDPEYYNPTSRQWKSIKDWLGTGSVIPDDEVLAQQLTSRRYGFDARSRVQLESKKDMKRPPRSLESPDRADALALTFAQPLVVETNAPARAGQVEHDYDVLGD